MDFSRIQAGVQVKDSALVISLSSEMEKELKKASPEKADIVLGGFFGVQPNQELARCSFNLAEKKVVITGTKSFVEKAEKAKNIVFGEKFELGMERVEGTNSYVLGNGIKPKIEEKPKTPPKPEPIKIIPKQVKPKKKTRRKQKKIKPKPEPLKVIPKPKKRRIKKTQPKPEPLKVIPKKTRKKTKKPEKITRIKVQRIKSKNPQQTIKQLTELYG